MHIEDPESAVILVADGEERVLREVASTLEKAGFKVLTALGRTAALDCCRARAEAVQLAIVDLAMAESGPDLVDSLYQSYPDIRILFTSTRDESELALPARPARGARGYLRKPFRRSRLLGRVLKVMDAPLAYTA